MGRSASSDGERRAGPPATRLYFAYGSNLDRAGMLSRCPAAVPLGRAVLADHSLVFRRWADVVPAPGRRVDGGLWRVTPDCEAVLDAYEEVDAGLYRRLLVPVRPDGAARDVPALVYRMADAAPAPPDPAYLAVILRGCDDFGLDAAPLREAAEAAEAAALADTAPHPDGSGAAS